jgi:two-component system KDP operon response regulator KdpE
MTESILANRLVLVVDDERRIVQFVRLHFELKGARVIEAHTGAEALEQARANLPDLVILDVSLPGELDGFDTLAALRAMSDVPVIMLTVRADEVDRIRGLDLGADDYMGKPFSPGELVSRSQAVLRRVQTPSDNRVVTVDEDLQIDFGARQAIVRGEPVKLRPTEWRLLFHLVANAGWLLTHDMILAKVWGPEYLGQDNYVRLYITYLRQKIEPDPANPKYILTERGAGYRFVGFEGAKGNRLLAP